MSETRGVIEEAATSANHQKEKGAFVFAKARTLLRNLVVMLFCLVLLVSSSLPPGNQIERVRAYTRTIEFDYVTWTLNALLEKTIQAAVGASRYLTTSQQVQLVNADMLLVNQIDGTQDKIAQVYSDPQVTDPGLASAEDSRALTELRGVEQKLQPVSESILQQQVGSILAENMLTTGGQPIPPVMFRSTPLPLALIISPRNVIKQDANISLVADLTLPQMVELENEVEKNLNVSALVVPVGGVGIYPTMVMSTTDLPWLAETISHEWTHNYLTLRPLGMNYDTSSALRTMNETAASIVGKEIGQELISRYYPDRQPPAPEPASSQPQAAQPKETPVPNTPPPFSFQREMRLTRVTTDQMLAEGKIQEAEAYLEARRIFFWNHGYQIRRLNQAYFAFYGAYADVPGGAAGSDPVGPAVRALRASSKSLADFLNRISWMTSFEQLKKAVP